MDIMPKGDYYVWYCEWCDSRNLTFWTKLGEEKVLCGACHSRFPIPPPLHASTPPASCEAK